MSDMREDSTKEDGSQARVCRWGRFRPGASLFIPGLAIEIAPGSAWRRWPSTFVGGLWMTAQAVS
ncbi:MAG: hypothetical protein IMY86_11905 [Chloroflexi bacterium]|nr:hypothetical protein [Chloroflexota bacterium]